MAVRVLAAQPQPSWTLWCSARRSTASCCSSRPGLAIGGVLAGLLVGALWRAEIRPTTFIWQGAVAVAAFAAAYVAMLVSYGFDLLVDRAPAGGGRRPVQHRGGGAPTASGFRQNLFDFLIGLGFCQAVLAAPALFDGLMSGGPARQRLTTPAVIVTGSLVATVALTDLLGVNRGEVVRLWIFLACAGQLPAAYVCARLNSQLAMGIVLAVTLLHDALGTSMIRFITPWITVTHSFAIRQRTWLRLDPKAFECDATISGQIVDGDLPDDVLVHAKIIVDDLMTHTDDVCPANFWMLVPKFARDLAGSLADRLDEMNQSKTKVFITVECGP